MDDYIERQIRQLRFQIADYRAGRLSLGSFISRIEGLGRTVGGGFWDEGVSPVAYELELINSELIDKSREPSSSERQEVEQLLQKLELLASKPPASE